MTDPDALRSLAAELCEAEEGSRELDDKIAIAFFSVLRNCAPDLERGAGHWIHPEYGLTFTEEHTTSLDAKLPGEDIGVMCGPGLGDRVSVWDLDKWLAVDRRGHSATAHTEPLARRAAGLLAMAKQKEREQGR